MGNLSWFLLTILVTSCVCDAYKILVVFPLPGKSHSILGDGHVRHLLDAGHEVTYITPFPKENVNPKLKQIDVSDIVKMMPKTARFSIKTALEKDPNVRDRSFLFFLMSSASKSVLELESIQKFLLDSNRIQFDVVIAEWMFSELYSGIATVFNCPLIWFSSVEPHWMILRLIDEITNPSYTPDILSDNVPPFSFKQRLEELWYLTKSLVVHDFFVLKQENQAYEDIYGRILAINGRTLPAYEKVKYNGSLVLGNSHVSMGEATRLPQSYKPIGGYHIDTNLKPLPEDLKKIMDNAKHGVIYFSMGSNLESKDMPYELKNSLLKMFGALKQTVLWKFEEVLSNSPPNVHILEWAPQPSILAHPNCILFITHGGLLSTTETIHFGVPIIGIPVFADQFINVDRAVKKGFARKVHLSYSMADELKVAIDEVTTNPRYKEKVKELSIIYHDRPVSPGKELVHWVEHVIRTKGAPHLRSPAIHVPWYQKAYLDLFAFVLVIVTIVLVTLMRMIRTLKDTGHDQKKMN